MNISKTQWIKEIRNSTKENIVFLHPCYALCGKWEICREKAECLKDEEILHNVWRGKVIALNALEI
jgi:hypothetical protein